MREQNSIVATAYRYFAAVVEAGSIRAAARDLNIASSAVNRQILMLEEALGMPLFERVGRGLRLTETGMVMRDLVKTSAQDFDDALAVIDNLRGLQSGRVTIATVESVSVELLPRLLASFNEGFPGIEIALTVTGSDAVTGLIQGHDADLGFTFNPQSTGGLEIVYRNGFRIGAIVAPDHPLASRRSVSLAECFDHPIAYPARGLSLRTALDQALRDSKTPPRPMLEANSLRVMAALARQGRCIAFQTKVGVEQHLRAGSLIYIAVNDKALPPDIMMLVRSQGREPSLAAKALAEHFVAGLAEHAFD